MRIAWLRVARSIECELTVFAGVTGGGTVRTLTLAPGEVGVGGVASDI